MSALREKIHTAKLYDLIQTHGFTPVSQRDKRVVLYNQILDELERIFKEIRKAEK